MRSAKLATFRLCSKPCSTCEGLLRQKGRIEDALRTARNLYSAAVETIDSTALRNPEEELKQVSAARKLICYAIPTHPTIQHSPTRGAHLAA
jgi:hypothetical protein